MKIIGSFLIIFVSVASSYYYERYQKEKQRALCSICDFLDFIKGQIEHFSTPLNKIFELYQNKNSYTVSLIEHKQIKCVSEATGDTLTKCFYTLGKGYKDEQIKTLDYTVNKVKTELSYLEKDYKQKTKVFRALAIFISCSVVILLV